MTRARGPAGARPARGGSAAGRTALARGAERIVRLDIAYVGTAYAGWQVQPGRATVQGTIEDALRDLLGGAVRLHGSGRTDAGAHARGQVAHFATSSRLPATKILEALNARIPPDVRVMAAADAGPGFHARRSARSKEYRYRIVVGDVLPPHLEPFAILRRAPLALAPMRRAASGILGTHDFRLFRANGSTAQSTVRTVTCSDWLVEEGALTYRIAADGFLYKMVRSITGCLLEIGSGARDAASIDALLAGERDDGRAWPILPARGLHLWRVGYDRVIEAGGRDKSGLK